jgi:hypothetical protein
MNKFSQIPGLDTLPTAGGSPEAAAPQPTFKVIYSPLDSLGKILADLDFKSYLENHFGDDYGELAHKIWVMYGGAEDELGKCKKGERKDRPQSSDIAEQSEIQEKEYNNTRNERWRRLPLGVGINEITNTEAIEKSIIGGYATLVKSLAKTTSASSQLLVKLANTIDAQGNYQLSDLIDLVILNVYPS